MKILSVNDPKFGMFLYKNALHEDLKLPERVEGLVKSHGNSDFAKWSEALVGDSEKRPEYRDCLDFKIAQAHVDAYSENIPDLKNIYNDVSGILHMCLDHYQQIFNIEMNYMEAINFVKYGPGQHFSVHSDHGFSYSCVVSSVMYLNDDYEGGELWFPYLDIKYKPEYGDIILFPSTYIYSHASLPVTSGIKYSAVTMFDYNDRNHQEHGKYRNQVNEMPLVDQLLS
jgi:hypothetical protein